MIRQVEAESLQLRRFNAILSRRPYFGKAEFDRLQK